MFESLILATLAFVSPLHAQEPTPEQVDAGRALYEDTCAMCHGRDMINAGGFAFDLRTFPKNDFARFRASVLNGKGAGMPAWRDKLSDDDVETLWAYVHGGGNN